jgi:hypothetical protein
MNRTTSNNKPTLQNCSCGEEIYCSKDCQKSHWLAHKSQCQNALRPKAAVSSSQSFEALSVKQLKNIMKAKAGTFADPVKRTKVLEQLENIVERPALIKFVSEHIQPAEVDKLLATPESSSKAQTTRTDSGTRTSSEPKKQKKKEVLPPMPSPEQMRQQAIMMRKNPDMVRRSNAALAGYSDAQIIEYADQLEKAAKDPDMLKEIMKVSRLSTDDRERLQKFQEGLSGVRPMDAAWIDSTVDTLRNHNEIIKTLFHGRGAMFGGVTDEQIDSFLDMLARQEVWALKLLVQTVLFLGSLVKPVSELYQKLDKATLGLAS